MYVSGKPGKYVVVMPVILNDNEERPYQHLRVRGELQQSRLWFDPLAIVLTPVPLQTAISIDFQILASSYIR